MDEIDSIQAEINDEVLACLDEPWPEEEQATTSTAGNISQLNESILTKALGGIHKDSALPDDMRNKAQFFIKNSAAQSKLRTALTFVNDCISKKGAFTSSQRQNALEKFFTKQVENMASISDVVKGKQAAALISSRVFEEMLNANFERQDISSPEVHVVISDEEANILNYIGGSIVRKVRQRAIKMSDHDERRKVTELVNDMASRGSSTGPPQQDMIGILDRGGLSRPCPNMQYAFCTMEAEFRRLFPINLTTMKEDDFSKACLDNEQITCGYYESVCEVDCCDRLKEKVLRIILTLFFKIRSHHKCRKIIDKYKREKSMAGKAKSLRKTLKRRNDDDDGDSE